MVINSIKLHGDIDENTRLYRYISLSQFMSFVESNLTTLTQVRQWQDTWEIPFRYIAVVEDTGKNVPETVGYIDNPVYNQVFGQCWSKDAESDAMWRIYSPNKEGLVIATTVKRFASVGGIRTGVLAPVMYYDDVFEGRNRIREIYGTAEIFFAFLKRRAFEHEHEVRLATLNNKSWLSQVYEDYTHIKLSLNPLEFIDEITIDPRASSWYVDTIKDYCERVGFTVVPAQSRLYAPIYPGLPSGVIKVPSSESGVPDPDTAGKGS